MPDHPLMILTLASLALLVRAGMAAYASGMTRSKNAAATFFRSICDVCFAALAFWPIYVRGVADAHSFVYLVMALVASGIIGPVLAERTKLLPLCIVSIAMAAGIVPLAGYVEGMLVRAGFFPGGRAAVIHLTGGVCALVGAILVGPRNGKYNRDGSSNLIPAHNLAVASFGVLIMLVGWLPYVLVTAERFSGNIAANVLLSGAAGAVIAMTLSHIRYGKPDILLTYGGLLGGLVAITGAPASVNTLSAVVIGAIAGFIVPTATVLLDLRFKIDDPAGAIAIHGVGGLWGTLAAGIFLPNPASQKLRQLLWQMLGAVSIAGVAAISALILFLALRATIGLRCSEADEYDGLDLAEHDLNAYPDFQQTMIKSYHMREA